MRLLLVYHLYLVFGKKRQKQNYGHDSDVSSDYEDVSLIVLS